MTPAHLQAHGGKVRCGRCATVFDSFALWGSLSYTWAPVGQTPQVKTTGLRKGYKVFGAIEFFNGQLFYQGTEERFNSDTYQIFLQALLARFPRPDHPHPGWCPLPHQPSHPPVPGFAPRPASVYQRPSYSPDYNPIEYLWKKVKTKATHNRYFAEFVKLVHSVEQAMVTLATQMDEILRLMGVYSKHMTNALPS